ncbi:MAG TPA: preprotein translocase subunit SecE [Candidatus Peribacteraceae bacterium]|nr:preprotein translocase subunit SecE [Candidatus Peribacteraceae bacterium]
MNAIITYINESVAELRQVRWPTRQQAVRLALITVGFTLVAAAVFGLLDYLLSLLIQALLQLVAFV